MMSVSAALIFASAAFGSVAGAITANHSTRLKSGMPETSAIAGTLGKSGVRFGVVTAMARTFPDSQFGRIEP